MNFLKLFISDFKKDFGLIVIMIVLISATLSLSISTILSERSIRVGSASAAKKFDLIIGAKGSEINLVLSSVFLNVMPLDLVSNEILKELKNDKRVKSLSPIAFGDYHENIPIVGIYKELLNGQIIKGKNLEDKFDAVIGYDVNLKIGDSFNPMHGKISQKDAHIHKNITYKVVGVKQKDGSAWDRAILVPIEAIWQSHLKEDDHTDKKKELGTPAIVVKPTSFAAAYLLRQQYKKNKATTAVFPAEILTSLYGLLGDLKSWLLTISIALQILACGVVFGLSFLFIRQKKEQITQLRVFGANIIRIMLYVWCELTAIIFVGMAFGIFLGFIFAKIACLALGSKVGFLLVVRFEIGDFIFLAILLLILVALMLIPVARIYTASVANSLKNS